MHFAFLVSNLPSVYEQLSLHAQSHVDKLSLAASIKCAIARWVRRA